MTGGVAFPLADIAQALRRYHGPQRLDTEARTIGVVMANDGSHGVVAGRWGPQAVLLEALESATPRGLAEHAADRVREWAADAVFVDSHSCAAALDLLRQMGHQVTPVALGGPSYHREQHRTRRDELHDELRRWIEDEGALPDDPMTRRAIAAAGGLPDAMADALALTFAAPVVRRPGAFDPTRRRP